MIQGGCSKLKKADCTKEGCKWVPGRKPGCVAEAKLAAANTSLPTIDTSTKTKQTKTKTKTKSQQKTQLYTGGTRMHPLPGPYIDINGIQFPGPEPFENGKQTQGTQGCKQCEIIDPIQGSSNANNIATNRRRRLFEYASAPCKRSLLDPFYKQLSICPAPLNFNANNLGVDLFLANFLHLLYGECIIPGTWIIRTRENEFTRMDHLVSDAIFAPTLMSLDDAIKYVRKCKTQHVFMAIGVLIGQNGGGHSMILSFYKTGDIIVASVIDPHMTMNTNEFNQAIIDHLSARATELDIVVRKTVVNPDKYYRLFQGSNLTYGSHLDRDGSCTIWRTLIMELLAIGLLKGRKSSNPLDLIELPGMLPMDDFSLFRKLIIDYTFTRIAHCCSLARFLGYMEYFTIIRQVIAKFASYIYHGRVLDQIRSYIPEFDTSALPRLHAEI